MLSDTVKKERAKAEAKKELVNRCLSLCDNLSLFALSGIADVDATGEDANARLLTAVEGGEASERGQLQEFERERRGFVLAFIVIERGRIDRVMSSGAA